MNQYQEQIQQIIIKYINNTEEDLKERWNSWEKDLTMPEQYEVIGGLMSRQIAIAHNFLRCNVIWNGEIAPIIMRSMVDNYINFAWIMEKPLERSRKFIYFGLGKAKLILEHRKKEMEHREINENERKMIEFQEEWINRQRFTFLTEVSLKSWSETPVRKMAEEANCLDLYNYVYQPFSSVAHNMWNHIAKYNLIESQNPLHKFFRKPVIFRTSTDIHFAELAVKYVDKMLMLYDEKIGFKPTRENACYTFLDDLDELGKIIAKELDE